MNASPITFIVPGHPSGTGARAREVAAATAVERRGTLRQSVTVAARRDGGGEVRVTAKPGEDVVVLHLENGPSLTLHPEHARDLILAQSGVAANRGSTSTASVDAIRVPPSFRWRGLEATVPTRGASRSRLGDVVLRGIDIIKDAAGDLATDFISGKAQSLAASLLVRRVDEQVQEGVYQLQQGSLVSLHPKDAGTQPLATISATGTRMLVLVHGTFSTTAGTFGKLWTKHPELVGKLFSHYTNQVYALDHRTLGASPLGNALTLARALPAGARVHLVTHSRGGLVAETLARACADGDGAHDLFEVEGYDEHRRDLRELLDIVKTRQIKVDRVVRVACPARGTLLASKRVDAYLSILKWTLDLAGIPVAGAVLDFINGVAQHRTDPELIPGLAAQIPNSPLVQWIHRVERPLDGDLRVVAGDVEGDSVSSWLKTLLADGFYWTDNDFVVQTGSMYGGTPRRLASTFALDQGGKVSHFNYFTSDTTAGAVVRGLIDDEPAGFQPIGRESYAGKSSTGVRAAARGRSRKAARTAPSDPGRAAVVLVPGIFGSHLKDGRGRVWLSPGAVEPWTRLVYPSASITADGLLEGMYEGIEQALAQTHEVIPFAYDWRQSLERSAADLATQLEAALQARDATGQPVRILAHSSGGLVVRALQLDHAPLWDRWLAHAHARLLMLGTPQEGLWAPMQLLSGDDTLGGTVTFFSPPFREAETRRILAGFPGLLQLQAGLLDEPALQDPRTWKDLADDDARRVTAATTWHSSDLQARLLEWGIPDEGTFKTTLEGAVTLQRRLAQQSADALHASKLLLVSGQAPLTPAGYVVGPEGFTYIYTAAGDGYVTHQRAALPGVRAWVVNAGHDALPSTASAFDVYIELLEQGTTTRLSPATAPGVRSTAREGGRGEAQAIRMRPAHTPKPVAPPGALAQMLGTTADDSAAATDAETLRVTIINGDLSFVRQPLMLGHYRSSKLTGTERVMDRLIGGAMTASLKKGQYPDGASSHQVFLNTRPGPDGRQLPRPEAVVIVGLGEEGKLRPADLAATVRQGVLAWAQRLSESRNPPPTFQLATTLIGSGGIDVTTAQSAQLIVQGVREANQRLSEEQDGAPNGTGPQPWPRVSHLSLIEIYLDRAAEAWRALRMTPDVSAHEYTLDEVVQSGVGALPRPIDASYRGADYDFIRIETRNNELGPGIAYTLDTRRARSESRPQPVQAALIKELVEQSAHHRAHDTQIGRTLFRLLVPVELEVMLTGDTDAQIEVDRGTAGIPWELLETNAAGGRDKRPWAVRTKLLRKLKTADYRAQVMDAGLDAKALVIGEPLCDPTLYPRLPGAVAEANAVAETLIKALRAENVRLLGEAPGGSSGRADARTIINTLLDSDWRIVHIAGHGELPEDAPAPVPAHLRPQEPPDPRGVVLSSGVYLGPREINSMRTVPELVFVNCCHLAARAEGELLTAAQVDCAQRFAVARPRFAAGVAESLISIGVRCVVAAGWAVDDEPAKVFAVRFYEALDRGERFIDAVAEAREAAAREPGSNTWGAYQCYGDPDWTLRRREDGAQGSPVDRDEFAVVASSRGLELALETIVTRIKYQNRDKAVERQNLTRLQERFESRWGGMGRVAEAFGDAWAEAGERTQALRWYRRALTANDGRASIRAALQIANLDVRVAWGSVSEAASNEPHQLAAAITKARRTIQGAIAGLKQVVALGTSMDRESLLGSAYKRLAMIEALARTSQADDAARKKSLAAEVAAINAMRDHYARAEALGREHGLKDFDHPALNRFAADLALAAGNSPVDVDSTSVATIRAALEAHVDETPDFWNVVGQTELRVYEAMATGRLAGIIDQVIDAHNDLQRRIGQSSMWASVSDSAGFVLSRYMDGASPAEQDAARRLLDHLRALST